MFKDLCVVAAAIALLSLVFFSRSPVFSEGKKVEYYIGKDGSSCTVISVTAGKEQNYHKYFDLNGEAISGLNRAAVEKIKKDLNAVTVMTETVGIINSEYLYSKKVPCYKLINGKKVNIHIAYDGAEYKVGTPIIFGGY